MLTHKFRVMETVERTRTVRLAPTACDNCLDALNDEGYEGSRLEMVALLLEIGGEIPNHTCATTTGEAERCNCACRKSR